MTPDRHVIIGTAGHIDHGKTALVKALTGIETDTHPQERARGLTIDVGFAYWKEGVTLLDVPGHERFVKNAVAGVSSVDLALFVVAADDGVMPQTREHLAILRLLGVSDGIVALTKTDLVEPEWVEMVVEDLRELLAGTFLEAAEIVPVSSVTGEGIDRLRELLEARIAGVGERPDRGALRLPVDRAFSMSGFGTVVTGTVLAGSVRPRDELVLQPRGRPVRVRGVQIHGRDVAAAGPGDRAAVNLSDVDVDEVARGDTLAEPGFFEATSLIDAHLHMLPDAPAVLKHRDRLRLHLGPGEVLGRVVLLDADALAPGESGFVQLRLERPGVAAHGDRFVARRYSPARTIAGGSVLHPRPRPHRRRRPEVLEQLRRLQAEEPGAVLEALLLDAGAGSNSAADLAPVLGRSVAEVEARLGELSDRGACVDFEQAGRRRFVHAGAWERLGEEVLAGLAAFHEEQPLQPAVSREGLSRRIGGAHEAAVFQAVAESLAADGQVRLEAGRLSLPGHRVELTAEQEALRQEIAAALRDGGARPPDEGELPGRLGRPAQEVESVVAVMQQRGDLVRLGDGLLFDAGVMERIESDLVAYLREHGQIEVAGFRELVDTTRRFALPLLNYFDGKGLTQREDALRRLVPGAVDSRGNAAGD